MYICDLGSDALWRAEREGESGLKVTGKAESKKGFTPRHSTLSPDGMSPCPLSAALPSQQSC